MSAEARAVVMARIRAALGASPEVPDIPRGYHEAGAAGPAGSVAAVERFAERVADYKATVHRTDAGGLDEKLATLLDGKRFVAVARMAATLGPVRDAPPLSSAELDSLDAVLTGCALAIADTGTIVLDGGEESGRRAITLIPDHHVCVVRAERVVMSVPDAFAAMLPAARRGQPLTLVSGPSATSDIELERVEGVHGPRRLDVVLLHAAGAPR